MFGFWLWRRYALDKVLATYSCRIKITTNNCLGFDYYCDEYALNEVLQILIILLLVTWYFSWFWYWSINGYIAITKISFEQNTSESLDTVQPHACLASPSGSNLWPWFNVHWWINPRSLNFLEVVFFINCGISEEKALFFQTELVSLVKWVVLAVPRIQGCLYSVML